MRSFTLNAKEKSVYSSLSAPKGDDDKGEFMTLEDIAKSAFGDQKRGSAPKSKGNSWVRNSMRKLLALKLVVHGSGKSGKYARTRLTLKDLADKERDRLTEKATKEQKAKEKATKQEAKPRKRKSSSAAQAEA